MLIGDIPEQIDPPAGVAIGLIFGLGDLVGISPVGMIGVAEIDPHLLLNRVHSRRLAQQFDDILLLLDAQFLDQGEVPDPQGVDTLLIGAIAQAAVDNDPVARAARFDQVIGDRRGGIPQANATERQARDRHRRIDQDFRVLRQLRRWAGGGSGFSKSAASRQSQQRGEYRREGHDGKDTEDESLARGIACVRLSGCGVAHSLPPAEWLSVRQSPAGICHKSA